MGKENVLKEDVQLVHEVLSGDDEAFTTLIRKYQRGVCALAWRWVKDFQVAEEIMQEAFVRAYERLAKLKDPQNFAEWLYDTTNQLCYAWLRKNKSTIPSLKKFSV